MTHADDTLAERLDERFDRVEEALVRMEQVTTGLRQDMNRLHNSINRGAIGIAIAVLVAVFVEGG